MSTASSSSSRDGSGDGGNGGGEDSEGPSHSHQRFSSYVWPEPFLEDLATQIAIDAAVSSGRLAAAPALSNFFQVCRRWQTISQSHLLWQNLTRHIWHHNHLLHSSWHAEYIYRHRTARNFRSQRCIYTTIPLPPNDRNYYNFIYCSRLTVSDDHLAAGFSEGFVRLYHLPTRVLLSTFYALQHDHVGPSLRAICGIFFANNNRLVFASLDGDIHVASIDVSGTPRRAHFGDEATDGVLIDFTGCNRWWVGLYAGVCNRALRVRNAITEELVFVGGALNVPYLLSGWHWPTHVNEHVGRIRITSEDLVVAFTRTRVMVFDLRNQTILREEVCWRRIIVDTADAYDRALMFVSGSGVANIRRVGNLEEIGRFRARNSLLACMNGGYSMITRGCGIRVWEWHNGEYLYIIGEMIRGPTALTADETYVVACTNDTIHLWYFGAHSGPVGIGLSC